MIDKFRFQGTEHTVSVQGRNTGMVFRVNIPRISTSCDGVGKGVA